jgi:hypothetical protein
MLIAREKRRTNIAEYILYMWHVEDSLRSCSFNRETIEQKLVGRFQADEETSREISDWYMNLAVMMEKEQVQESGHIQVLKNLVNDLNEFHFKMLQTGVDAPYVYLYQQNRATIEQFMKKSYGNNNAIEVCLNALYVVWVLRMNNSPVSEKTQQTVDGLARLTGHLSTRYLQFENDDFEF